MTKLKEMIQEIKKLLGVYSDEPTDTKVAYKCVVCGKDSWGWNLTKIDGQTCEECWEKECAKSRKDKRERQARCKHDWHTLRRSDPWSYGKEGYDVLYCPKCDSEKW